METAAAFASDFDFESPSPDDWRAADRRLVFLARGRHQLDHETGRALLDALRAKAHEHLGFGTFTEYAERRFGFNPRYTRERLRVAERLEELPLIDEALMNGEVSWSAVREVTRVAEDHCEDEWLECAKEMAQRDLETLVARHARGERPSDPPHPDARRHVLRRELSGSVYALWRDVEAKLREEAGEDLDADEVFAIVARRILQGPSDDGRASYQMSVTTCRECGQTTQLGRGEQVPLEAVEVEMAQCDAQRIDERGHAQQDVPPAVRRQVIQRELGRCAVPGCRNATWLDVHHVVLRSEGGTHDASNLVALCDTHHRRQHRGTLLIERTASGLAFKHADGSPYGGTVDPDLAGLAADVFMALRRWGAKETEAKRAVAAVTQLGRVVDHAEAIRIALAALRSGRAS